MPSCVAVLEPQLMHVLGIRKQIIHGDTTVALTAVFQNGQTMTNPSEMDSWSPVCTRAWSEACSAAIINLDFLHPGVYFKGCTHCIVATRGCSPQAPGAQFQWVTT